MKPVLVTDDVSDRWSLADRECIHADRDMVLGLQLRVKPVAPVGR